MLLCTNTTRYVVNGKTCRSPRRGRVSHYLNKYSLTGLVRIWYNTFTTMSPTLWTQSKHHIIHILCVLYPTLRNCYVGDALCTVVCSSSHVTYKTHTSKINRKMSINHFLIFVVWITPYTIGKSYLYTYSEHKFKDVICAQGEPIKCEGGFYFTPR